MNFQEIPKYLAASDMGVLLRHRHIINEIVSNIYCLSTIVTHSYSDPGVINGIMSDPNTG